MSKPTFEYSGRSNKDIIDEIQKALQMNEETAEEPDSINIQVEDGRVHLAGTVSSLEIQERIDDIVENTHGVAEVIDDLVVEKI
ncbi:MAG: BON domain-containing protein [Patescibacteria group bacterium]